MRREGERTIEASPLKVQTEIKARYRDMARYREIKARYREIKARYREIKARYREIWPDIERYGQI